MNSRDYARIRGFAGVLLALALATDFVRAAESRIATHLADTKPVYDKPRIIVTETGYHTALFNAPNRHPPVSEEAKAVYLPRVLLENFRLGIERSYIYQLVDDRPADPGEQEANFGLLTAELEPKANYHALRNLLAILRDDGRRSEPPGSLDFQVPDAPAGLRTVLLQKAGGAFYLAIWRPLRIWDEVARQPVPVTSVPVTVAFAAAIATCREYRPVSRSRPRTSTGSRSTARSPTATTRPRPCARLRGRRSCRAATRKTPAR